MQAANNYRGERNPFKLAVPPAWWLQQLHDIDPALQVFPSITNPCFVIARRTPNAAKYRFLVRMTRYDQKDNRAEAQRLLAAGCVFVKAIETHWTTHDWFLNWLRANDTWKPQAPSHDAAIDKSIAALEAREADLAARQQAAADDESEMRASSGYTAMLLRRGNMAFVHRDPVDASLAVRAGRTRRRFN